MATLFVAVASLALAQSQQPEPPKPVQTKPNRPSNRQQQAVPPITITVTTPPPSPEQLKAEREARERQEAIDARVATANDTIARLTVWLVVVGALEALGTVFAFIVSIRASNAAQRSAEVAEQALIQSSRAILSFVQYQVNWLQTPIRGRSGIILRGVIANTGNGPALQCYVAVKKIPIQGGNDTTSHPSPQEDMSENPRTSSGTVAARGDMKGGVLPILFDELDQIRNNTLVIFIHTACEYRDGFAKTPTRMLAHCSVVKVTGDYHSAKEAVEVVAFPSGPADHNHAN